MKRYSICSIGAASDNAFADPQAARLGVLLSFAAMSPFHRGRNLGESVNILKTALYFNQLKIYFNNYGDCIGYVAWAMLSPGVKAELEARGRRLDTIEWNEGTCPWIVDLLVRPGSLGYVVDDLRNKVFKGYPSVSYGRHRGGKRLVKMWPAPSLSVRQS